MTVIVLYVATFILFIGLDFVGLTYIVKPVFEKSIGHLLLDSFRIGPAVVFYAFYVAVLLWFVSWPAVTQDRS